MNGLKVVANNQRAVDTPRPTQPNAIEPTIAGNLPDAASAKTEDIWRWARRQAIGRMELSFGARECWRVLDAFPPGECYPSHWHIGETLCKSKSQVCRYLRELKEGGYIEIEPRCEERWTKRRPRGQTSNSYLVRDQPDLIARTRQIVQDYNAKHSVG